MARLSAAPGLLRSASRSKRAKVTFSYLRNSHNKCGCYHFTGRTDYHCAEIECGHWRVFAYFAHDDDKGFPV